MQMQRKLRFRGWRSRTGATWLALASAVGACTFACRSTTPPIIAVIPRTSGTGLWEPEHGGAETGAIEVGSRIYWNAPTREDDVEGQISLVEQVISRRYQGLVLAPDQALALITPVRRALARGVPTVIVGSPLPIPPGGMLSYILNDEEAGGRIAAERVAELIHGRGSVAILGLNPDVAGIMIRARSLELFLSQNYPEIHIVKRMGSFNVLREQQVAEEALKANPDINVIVGLMWPSARGALSATESNPSTRTVKVVGFDPEGGPPFDIANLDSAIVQDMRTMGQRAVELVDAQRHGRSVPAVIKLQPTLITRANMDTPESRRLTNMDWRPGHWDWNPNQ
jgi:ribose transport system substrate-binding protein